jgi:hypothetical protein
VDGVGFDLAWIHKVLHFSDRRLCRRRHHRIEVARGLSEHQIAQAIAFERAHQREVGFERHLEHVRAAVDGPCLLALRHDRADAGRRVEAAYARAARANALRERPLGHELDLELAGEELPLELAVLADVSRNHLADLFGLEDRTQTEVVDARVVADDSQPLRPLRQQRGEQVLGITAHTEPANHDRRAIGDLRDGLGGRHDHFVHGGDYGSRSPLTVPSAKCRALSGVRSGKWEVGSGG